ncbi:MAG: hypothetical protein PF569_09430 [Candidatus Woesearchaeota archaeon]|jgi:hypothetical protein|nr:hypothetical protein [Candidatus Woesearchaeota archaeon]
MVSKKPIFITDFNALDRYKKRLDKIESERERIRNYNKLAMKEKRKLIHHKILHNLRNKANFTRKKIDFLETKKDLKSKEYEINNVLVVENYKENQLEFHLKEQLGYKTIKKLVSRNFEWNKNKNCWSIDLNTDTLKYLKILKELN